MKIKGIALQDVHFGIKDSARLYKELDFFKNYVLSQNDLDFININGDYFDRKLSLSDSSAFYAISFFDELVQICIKKNIKLRVIQGTRSHDMFQIFIFAHYLGTPGLDLNLMDVVTEEEYKGCKILYVPEEYPENADEYYKDFRSEQYHLIHGHGTWDFVAFKDQIANGNQTDTNSAPVFMYKDWEYTLEHGVAIFGHIHNRNIYKNKIYYSGSYTRWIFGEPAPKGFIEYEIDTETNNHIVKFVSNLDAPSYNTLNLSEALENVSNISAEELIEFTDSVIQAMEEKEYLRFDTAGLSEANLAILTEHYSKNNHIKYKNTTTTKPLLEADEKAQEAIYDKYAYILNRILPIDQTIKKFVKDEYDHDIDIETIRKYLIAQS